MTATVLDSQAAAAYLRNCAREAGLSDDFRAAVILGSGLGRPGDRALQQNGVAVPYYAVPGMPTAAVAGHAGRVVIGAGPLAGVLLFQGRVHYYEGHSLTRVTYVAQILGALKVRSLVVTNAAGGIRQGFRPGDLMLLNGHWSFVNVRERRVGSAPIRSGCLWCSRFRQLAQGIPTPLSLHEGVYAMMSGPNYETPAEVRMLARLGVDAVGMSTLPEALVAAGHGIEVLGVSCITNIASGLSDSPLDHCEVSHVAASIDEPFSDWLLTLLQSC
ncbi:MAG: purine-nucleoside phosphorylase [Fuerstiella sp.]